MRTRDIDFVAPSEHEQRQTEALADLLRGVDPRLDRFAGEGERPPVTSHEETYV
jgi:hypothetical protein